MFVVSFLPMKIFFSPVDINMCFRFQLLRGIRLQSDVEGRLFSDVVLAEGGGTPPSEWAVIHSVSSSALQSQM